MNRLDRLSAQRLPRGSQALKLQDHREGAGREGRHNGWGGMGRGTARTKKFPNEWSPGKGQNQRIGIFPLLYGRKTPMSFLPP